MLAELTSLTELYLDETSLNFTHFLRLFDKPLKSLEKLSLLGYFDVSDFELHLALLTDDNLREIFNVFPDLKHLNLSSKKLLQKAKHYCPFKISMFIDGLEVSDSKRQ
jgi:hypothetical protein